MFHTVTVQAGTPLPLWNMGPHGLLVQPRRNTMFYLGLSRSCLSPSACTQVIAGLACNRMQASHYHNSGQHSLAVVEHGTAWVTRPASSRHDVKSGPLKILLVSLWMLPGDLLHIHATALCVAQVVLVSTFACAAGCGGILTATRHRTAEHLVSSQL